MSVDNFIRDSLELTIAFAVGATLVGVLLKIKRGEVRRVQCSSCNRPTSRMYKACPRCGGELKITIGRLSSDAHSTHTASTDTASTGAAATGAAAHDSHAHDAPPQDQQTSAT